MNELYKYDNSTLIFLQDKFLAGDNMAKKYLWVACERVARRIISKEIRQKGLHFDKGEIYDKAITGIEYVLRRYSKYKSYRIEKNFVAQLYGGVLHAMYYQTKGRKLEKQLVKAANAYIKRGFDDLNYYYS